MRKILVKLPKPDVVDFKFGEAKTKVMVKTYISLKDESTLISTYLDDYFNSNEEDLFEGVDTNFQGAEVVFDMAILDIMTNIKIDSNKIDMDDIYSSSLMMEVRGRISNLPQVRKRLERIVADAKQERFSAKGTISGIIKEITTLVKGLDFSEIQKLAEEIKGLESDIKESKIKTLMDEGMRNETPSKKDMP